MKFPWISDRLFPSRSAKKPGRIFLIGHNKCGTRSFVRLLRSNGYKSIHFGRGRAARRIQANFTFSRPLLEGLDRFTGYADLEVCGEFYAYRLFPQLDLQYPGSTFVYNKRDVNAWIKSRLNHSLRRNGSYVDRYLNRMREAFNDPSLDIDDLRRHWKQAWNRHETDLERYFSGRNNYFAFDIGVPEEQAKLCSFLRRRGYCISGDALPHVGATQTSDG